MYNIAILEEENSVNVYTISEGLVKRIRAKYPECTKYGFEVESLASDIQDGDEDDEKVSLWNEILQSAKMYFYATVIDPKSFEG